MNSEYLHLQKFIKKVKVEGELITRTAIHIGSQKGLDPMEADNPVIKDLWGRPFIPGSSFKGVIRSAMESLLEGIKSGGVNIKVCHPTEDKYCIEDKEKWKEIYEVLKEDRTCILCKFLGAPYLASKARFYDMPIIEEISNVIQIRDGVAIDRDSLTAAPKKKYDFETVVPGTKFALMVSVDNPEDYELGLMFFVWELINQGFYTLGGNTSRGLGQVCLEVKKITEWDISNILKAYEQNSDIMPVELTKKEDLEKYIKDKIQKFHEWIKKQGGRDV